MNGERDDRSEDHNQVVHIIYWREVIQSLGRTIA
jgi:hypothetical protein